MRATRLNLLLTCRLGALLVSADGPWRSRSSPPHLRIDIAPETFIGDTHASWYLPTSALWIRRFNPLWHLVSEGATHNTRSTDDGEIQKHTPAWSCCASSTTRPHTETARRASRCGPHHRPAA